MVQPKSIGHLVTDETRRCSQAFHRLLRFFFITYDGNHDVCRLAIRSKQHFGHGSQTYARIAQLTFDDSRNFFSQCLAEPSAMMFVLSVFHKTVANY